MQGMFRANGGCGYVKKPEFLLKLGPHQEVFDPKAKLPVKTTLKVNVVKPLCWIILLELIFPDILPSCNMFICSLCFSPKK